MCVSKVHGGIIGDVKIGYRFACIPMIYECGRSVGGVLEVFGEVCWCFCCSILNIASA